MFDIEVEFKGKPVARPFGHPITINVKRKIV
jgi:hypothetical protein